MAYSYLVLISIYRESIHGERRIPAMQNGLSRNFFIPPGRAIYPVTTAGHSSGRFTGYPGATFEFINFSFPNASFTAD